MPQYTAEGKVELNGATFFITADSLEEAKRKAKAGEWDDYNSAGAETINWEIRPATVKLNEWSEAT